MTTTNQSNLSSPFIFNWSEHASSISKNLQKLYEKKEYFDTHLIVGNDIDSIKIPAHKLVLLASSDYFREIFHDNPSKTSSNEVKLDKFEVEYIKPIVDFMYSGSIELNLESIEGLLRSAKLLKMKNLVDGCCEFIERNLNKNNCLHWLRLAKELNLTEFEEKTCNMVYKHFEEVTKQTEFLFLDQIELKNVLFRKHRPGGLESQVFLSLLAWIEHEKINRQPISHELLSMVHYQYLTPQFIIRQKNSVGKSVENYELMLNWLQFHMVPESRINEEPNVFQEENDDDFKNTIISINKQDNHAILDFDRTLESWALIKGSLPISVDKSICGESWIVFDSKLFRVGGFNKETNEASNKVSCTYLDSSRTIFLPSMRNARTGCKLAFLNQKLYVYGGFRDEDHTDFIYSVEVFNLSKKKWRELGFPFEIRPTSEIVGGNKELNIYDFSHGSVIYYQPSDASDSWETSEHPPDKDVKDFRVLVTETCEYAVCLREEVCVKNKNSRKILIKKCLSGTIIWTVIGEFLVNPCSRIRMAEIDRNRIFFATDECSLIEFNTETFKFKSRSTIGITDYGVYVITSNDL